jgi:hypothetical protein
MSASLGGSPLRLRALPKQLLLARVTAEPQKAMGQDAAPQIVPPNRCVMAMVFVVFYPTTNVGASKHLWPAFSLKGHATPKAKAY